MRARDHSSAVLITVLVVVFARAQETPTIDSVVNAASYLSRDRPGWAIAPGSLFVVEGRDLGPAPLMSFAGYPLGTSLGGTAIEVVIGGQTYRPYMIYTSPLQVAAVLPSETPSGGGAISIAYQGSRSRPFPMHVLPASFGIFARNQAGSGPGIIQNVVSSKERPLNGLTTPASPGQLATIWGTGLGAAPGNEAEGPIPGDMQTHIVVIVGGVEAKLVYHGRSGCCAGVDEIYFEVPFGIEGCRVPVGVCANSILSNMVSMAVAPPGRTCRDSELPQALLESVGRGEQVTLGRIELARMALELDLPGISAHVSSDLGHAHFGRYSSAALLSLHSPLSYFTSGLPSSGHCAAWSLPTRIVWPLPAMYDPVFNAGDAGRALEAGAQVFVSGSYGQKTLDGNRLITTLGGLDMETGATGPMFLAQDTYSIGNGSGGSEVGSFSTSLTIPGPTVWTNRSTLRAISRLEDLTVTWTASDAARQTVAVFALSEGDAEKDRAVVVCTTPATAGQLTLPASLPSQLPKTHIASDGLPAGWLGIATAPVQAAEVEFTAAGVHHARAAYVFVDAKYVSFK